MNRLLLRNVARMHRAPVARPTQRRSLHKNQFVEEWDAFKTDHHKTFSFNKGNVAGIFTFLVVIPACLGVWILAEDQVKGKRDIRYVGVAPDAEEE